MPVDISDRTEFSAFREGPLQKRALIVNDERVTSDLIAKVLYTAGMEALTVTRSSDAVGFLREGKFDVVFMDFHMAAPSGIELVRQIRASGCDRTIPIILISDQKNPTALAQAFDAGASFFLYKPIDQGSLLRLIRAAQGSLDPERRRTRRIPVQSRVVLRTDTQELEGKTMDVSLTGLRVKLAVMVPVGSPVHIRLYPSKEAQPVVGTGSVARLAGPCQMGIQLGRLSFAESERLQEFLLPLIPAQ
jgi:DNA-binding response OmpR family regulator